MSKNRAGDRASPREAGLAKLEGSDFATRFEVLTELGPDETLDAICNGAVRLIQRRRGYRFSVDAVLLADFASPVRGHLADLGTGCGVIPLMVAVRSPQARIVAVEIQPGLAGLAKRNVELNRCAERMSVLCADLRALGGALEAGTFDTVVSNPPYRPARSGRLNPDPEKALARHEVACALPDLARAARSLLKSGGRFMVIYPASRLAELLEAARAQDLQPRRLRLVHPKLGEQAKLVLLDARRNGTAELQVLPPLVLHDADGRYADEAQEILGMLPPDVSESAG